MKNSHPACSNETVASQSIFKCDWSEVNLVQILTNTVLILDLNRSLHYFEANEHNHRKTSFKG